MIIRDAVDADLDAILAIHNHAILHSTAIWVEQTVDRAEREAWFAERRRQGQPVLVAEEDGLVVGFASYSQWRPRPGYRHTVEDSVYIAGTHHARGIGRALVARLIEHAKAAGHHVMLADIETSNSASIALHKSMGFVDAGQLNEIGTKFGNWLSLTILWLPLE
ncbi:MAG TPA: GNAT family N-acetyltransferase [Galbitalea sp.]|jgi:phosphinothricin acetyltransferase|nr:GNAT family N-acetyltransferase [Galbitalea sp.]